MNFLFLYTELADYFINCCTQLSEYGTVHIVRWPVNKEAPFVFEFSDKLKVYNKNEYTIPQLEKLIAGINPDAIVCSGWIDKDYLKLVKPYYKKIPTILTCDTHWKGTFKQHLATILSRIFLMNRFSHAWVPGKKQHQYVQKLGFKDKFIKTGFYCCDLKKFNNIFENHSEEKEKSFPKRFLYVGRYYEFKGLTDLWEAFISLNEELPNHWELWCLGSGDLEPIKHAKIKHFGFVQPKELDPILKDTGVFILPSRFEPWGVVVQEYAAAGFPLLLSKEVGATEAFLEEGKNGFLFNKENVAEIKDSLKKIISLHDKELVKMSEYSHELAQKISPENWAKTLIDICNGSNKK